MRSQTYALSLCVVYAVCGLCVVHCLLVFGFGRRLLAVFARWFFWLPIADSLISVCGAVFVVRGS